MDGCIPAILPINEIIENRDFPGMFGKSVKLLGKKNCEHGFAHGLPSGNPKELASGSNVSPCFIAFICNYPVACCRYKAGFQAENFCAVIYGILYAV
jgi:hypothetical protein